MFTTNFRTYAKSSRPCSLSAAAPFIFVCLLLVFCQNTHTKKTNQIKRKMLWWCLRCLHSTLGPMLMACACVCWQQIAFFVWFHDGFFYFDFDIIVNKNYVWQHFFHIDNLKSSFSFFPHWTFIVLQVRKKWRKLAVFNFTAPQKQNRNGRKKKRREGESPREEVDLHKQ